MEASIGNSTRLLRIKKEFAECKLSVVDLEGRKHILSVRRG